MIQPVVTSRENWLSARLELLEDEKEFVRQRDTLSARRRALPWVEVTEKYSFKAADGDLTLSDLFGDKSQLIIQHFMMGEDWEAGCVSCSFWADGFNGTTAHMADRDAAFVAVSNTPLDQIVAFKSRMGWAFDWVSCHGSDFNQDYQATFDDVPEGSTVYYNYRDTKFPMAEAPGISIFAKNDVGAVFHTYSCYSRGMDNMNVAYQYLDLLPKGRSEDTLDYPMAWVKHHDKYDSQTEK